jgi:hypothetical protein
MVLLSADRIRHLTRPSRTRQAVMAVMVLAG